MTYFQVLPFFLARRVKVNWWTLNFAHIKLLLTLFVHSSCLWFIWKISYLAIFMDKFILSCLICGSIIYLSLTFLLLISAFLFIEYGQLMSCFISSRALPYFYPHLERYFDKVNSSELKDYWTTIQVYKIKKLYDSLATQHP
mgnify:CR=1 FL=1